MSEEDEFGIGAEWLTMVERIWTPRGFLDERRQGMNLLSGLMDFRILESNQVEGISFKQISKPNQVEGISSKHMSEPLRDGVDE